MPLQATSGAASYDAFGGGVPFEPTYIEQIFQTWLYTGNGSTQTITNGIDLAGKGGLVWLKDRSGASINQHTWVDTNRGVNNWINSASTFEQSPSNILSSYNTTGFTLSDSVRSNQSGASYVGWTFREQPKFFDVVTYTGDGSALKTIAHNLGSTPGCMIIKSTSSASWNWIVYHRSLGISQKIQLNLTNAAVSENGNFGGTSPTSTQFSVGFNATNESGGTYVAYLFAHDAGGFGLTGTDNVISCGTFTTDGSGNATVNLGYEPQWVMTKRTDAAGNWSMLDVMRGMTVNAGSTSNLGLYADSSGAEIAGVTLAPTPNATGMDYTSVGPSRTFIYIAIRRGPMKVPTDATKVFAPVTQTSTGSAQAVTTNFPVDFTFSRVRGSTSANYVIDRLRGSTSASARILISNTTDAEYSGGPGFSFDSNTQITDNGLYGASSSVIYECFRRAPSFFDEVCYTGDGTDMTINHNLGVVPELLIVKRRSVTQGWFTYSSGTITPNNYYLQLQSTAAQVNAGSQVWNNTATTFLAGTGLGISASTQTYVAYLFASAPGVSKVGAYTGNGTTQAIACGFTGGARFVLIKRTDSTGDWYVYDTARGMTVLTDPFLALNSTAAETATLGSVITSTGGFTVNASILAAINASGGSYVFLAIA